MDDLKKRAREEWPKFRDNSTKITVIENSPQSNPTLVTIDKAIEFAAAFASHIQADARQDERKRCAEIVWAEVRRLRSVVSAEALKEPTLRSLLGVLERLAAAIECGRPIEECTGETPEVMR